MLTVLTLAVLGQFVFPTPLPQYDPAGYQLRYAGHGYVIGPFAPPVGNPRVITLHPIGQISAIDDKAKTFDVQYPGYMSRYHYGPRTIFQNVGKLEIGRWVEVDVANYTVRF